MVWRLRSMPSLAWIASWRLVSLFDKLRFMMYPRYAKVGWAHHEDSAKSRKDVIRKTLTVNLLATNEIEEVWAYQKLKPGRSTRRSARLSRLLALFVCTRQ
jgi:hypothetical protein